MRAVNCWDNFSGAKHQTMRFWPMKFILGSQLHQIVFPCQDSLDSIFLNLIAKSLVVFELKSDLIMAVIGTWQYFRNRVKAAQGRGKEKAAVKFLSSSKIKCMNQRRPIWVIEFAKKKNNKPFKTHVITKVLVTYEWQILFHTDILELYLSVH